MLGIFTTESDIPLGILKYCVVKNLTTKPKNCILKIWVLAFQNMLSAHVCNLVPRLKQYSLVVIASL